MGLHPTRMCCCSCLCRQTCHPWDPLSSVPWWADVSCVLAPAALHGLTWPARGKIPPRLVLHFLLCQCLWGDLFILHASLVPLLHSQPSLPHTFLPLSSSFPQCPPSSAQLSASTSCITPRIHPTGPQTGHSPSGHPHQFAQCYLGAQAS